MRSGSGETKSHVFFIFQEEEDQKRGPEFITTKEEKSGGDPHGFGDSSVVIVVKSCFFFNIEILLCFFFNIENKIITLTFPETTIISYAQRHLQQSRVSLEERSACILEQSKHFLSLQNCDVVVEPDSKTWMK